jgi:hypothetical protein
MSILVLLYLYVVLASDREIHAAGSAVTTGFIDHNRETINVTFYVLKT